MPVGTTAPVKTSSTLKRIKMNTSISGNRLDPKTGLPNGEFAYHKGDIIDWPENEAKTFIDRGYATDKIGEDK